MSYDSRPDTEKHIARVRELLGQVTGELTRRGEVHDASKLVSPEVEVFDEYTPHLSRPGMEYGSSEYKLLLDEMAPTLRHHYAENDHHPEHFADGVNDMNLIQLVEMLADWKAAGERHVDGGDLGRSIRVNAKRYGYGPGLERALTLTAEALGWL